MEVLRQVSRVIDLINTKIGQAVAWLTLVIVILGAYNAIARYLAKWIKVDLSSNGFIELQWYLFAVILLLGASYTLQHNGHVRVDVIYDRITARQRAWINLIGNVLLLMPFCIFMIWASWPMVSKSWSILEMSSDPDGLPRYPIKTVLPVAFGLLLLQGISHSIKLVDELLTGTPALTAEDDEPEVVV